MLMIAYNAALFSVAVAVAMGMAQCAGAEIALAITVGVLSVLIGAGTKPNFVCSFARVIMTMLLQRTAVSVVLSAMGFDIATFGMIVVILICTNEPALGETIQICRVSMNRQHTEDHSKSQKQG